MNEEEEEENVQFVFNFKSHNSFDAQNTDIYPLIFFHFKLRNKMNNIQGATVYWVRCYWMGNELWEWWKIIGQTCKN